MKLTSKAFAEGGEIPQVYTCDGANKVPPLSWEGVPAHAKTLALVMDDPDIPDSVKESRKIEKFDHWVAYNMAPSLAAIEEGIEPDGALGLNSAGKLGYTGPCPPDREHRYFFKLYALDLAPTLPASLTREALEKAMEGHIIEQTQLIGRYERIKK